MSVTRLKGLLESWKALDLESFQKSLDEMATDMTVKEDEAQNSRKLLLENITNYIANSSEESRSEASSVISAFQKEIDSLDARNRQVEKSFLKVYQIISTEIHDPSSILESCLESSKKMLKLQDLEIETAQLRQTIQDYNVEIQRYKNTEKKCQELQTKVDAYDRNIDATLEAKIGDVTQKIVGEYEEKLKLNEVETELLNKKLHDKENQFSEMQRKYQESQTEMFDIKRSHDESSHATSGEVDIILNDLENANSRALRAERQVEALKEQLEINRQNDNPKFSEQDAISIQELNVKTREVERLMTQVSNLNEDREKREKVYEENISGLNREKQLLEAEITKINDKLEERSDYDEVKKDLNILKNLEFGNNDENYEQKSLGNLLLEKSKLLQNENSNLRVEKEKLTTELRDKSAKLDEISEDFQKTKKLNEELESHVESLQALSRRGEAEGRSSTELLSEALEGPSPSKEGLLSIISAQRDRLKDRNEELEYLNSKQLEQITLLQTEVTDLQSDNVKMYEKIRFLQSVKGRKPISDVDDVESRYQSRYEQHLDPFTSFNRQEKSRKYEQLNIAERIILSFIQFMMSNKFARMFVFIYSLVLHGLVFMVLMKLAYSESSKHDYALKWHEKYVQHMHQVHDTSVEAG